MGFFKYCYDQVMLPWQRKAVQQRKFKLYGLAVLLLSATVQLTDLGPAHGLLREWSVLMAGQAGSLRDSAMAVDKASWIDGTMEMKVQVYRLLSQVSSFWSCGQPPFLHGLVVMPEWAEHVEEVVKYASQVLQLPDNTLHELHTDFIELEQAEGRMANVLIAVLYMLVAAAHLGICKYFALMLWPHIRSVLVPYQALLCAAGGTLICHATACLLGSMMQREARARWLRDPPMPLRLVYQSKAFTVAVILAQGAMLNAGGPVSTFCQTTLGLPITAAMLDSRFLFPVVVLLSLLIALYTNDIARQTRRMQPAA